MKISEQDHEAAMDWKFTGEVGMSSEVICRVFLGYPVEKWPSTPSDADDLARCRLFLERLSEDGRAHALKLVSARCPTWAPLVREWQSVCAQMDTDCPTWRSGGSRWSDEVCRRLSVLLAEGYRLADPNGEVRTRADGTLSSYRGSGGTVAILHAGDMKRVVANLRKQRRAGGSHA